jgi:hypothetical protein
MDEERLVKRVYNQSRIEYTRRNKSNWIKTVHKLVQKYGLLELWNDEVGCRRGRSSVWLKKIFENIQKVEEQEWRNEIMIKPKLRLYKTFKFKLELESYLLTDRYRKGRCFFTALRTGSNRLRIETGRWKRPKEEERERVCMTCMSGEVENEKHFLLDCSMYDDLRKTLFYDISVVTERNWVVDSLIPESQWKILMGGTRDKWHNMVAEKVLCFLARAMKLRSQIQV